MDLNFFLNPQTSNRPNMDFFQCKLAFSNILGLTCMLKGYLGEGLFTWTLLAH
jgi:hypothetical protein